MSSSFDWSQFLDAPKDQPETASSFDWSQFTQEEERPSGVVPGIVSRFQKTPFEKGKKSPIKAFGEFNRALGKQAKEYGELAVEHPGRFAGELGVGTGKALNFPISALESWLRNEGVLSEENPQALTSELLEKAGGWLRENLNPEQQHKLKRLEDLGAAIPTSAVTQALKSFGKGLDWSWLKKAPPGEPPLPSFAREKDVFPSGLTKHKVVDSKKAERGLISPSKQKVLVEGLEKEAVSLAKKSVEKNLPLSKQIEEGFDFANKHEKEFGNLRATAKKFNPTIETDPLDNLFASYAEKYRGVPSLHAEARRIMKEIQAFRRKPTDSLSNLLKIVRSNNKKRARLFERAKFHGKMDEYNTFLGDMNKAIEESFAKTLPEDSAWLANYRKYNKDYSEYMDTQSSLKELESVLGEQFNYNSFAKLGIDKSRQNRLSGLMGREAASEVIQISKDLRTAVKAIERIPARSLTKFEAILPLSFIIPAFKPATIPAAIIKAPVYVRRAYGWYLTKPATRKAVDKALKAVSEGNLSAYEEAASSLKGSLTE